MEVWRDVVGYEGVYQVSNFGRVKRIRSSSGAISGRILKQGVNRRGVRNVSLSHESKPKTKTVHRLVALAFLGDPPTERHVVAHNDGNPSNNRLTNLRWATHAENNFDQVEHGTQKGKNRGRKSALTDEQIIAIRADKRSMSDIANEYRLSKSTIGQIKARKTHKHVPPMNSDYFIKSKRYNFTDEQVLNIRIDERSTSELANHYSCSVAAIRAIKAKRSYANVTQNETSQTHNKSILEVKKATNIEVYGDVAHMRLPSGAIVKFDTSMIDFVSQKAWRELKGKRTSYAACRVLDGEGKVLSGLMHRILMDAPDNMVVDHINGDGLDNRKKNLRIVTKSQNAMNSRAHVDNITGLKGSHYDKRKGTYYSRIKVDCKNIYLGTFNTAEEAAQAYADASAKYHGEYGRTHLDD